MASSKIPSLVKHCALAIYASGDIPGTPKKRIRSALNIAQAMLMRQGYLTPGSDVKLADRVGLTAAGQQREAVHAREGTTKDKKFDALYKLIERDDMRPAEKGDAAKDSTSPPPVTVRRRK